LCGISQLRLTAAEDLKAAFRNLKISTWKMSGEKHGGKLRIARRMEESMQITSN
jgi:hypothetical protein